MPRKSKAVHASLAKIARPTLAAIFPRTRLFRLLDQARRRKLIWVEAPPGAGKTALVSSYLRQRGLNTLWYQIDAGDDDVATFFHYLGLATSQAAPRHRRLLPHFTPEYRAGLGIFARRFFQELYRRLPRPFILVFDNYHEAGAGTFLHEVLREGLTELPPGGNAVILSRGGPLAAFARIRAAEMMAFLQGDDLKLTPAESNGIARLRRPKGLGQDALRRLYDLTQGWVAGLVLALERQTDELTGEQYGSIAQDAIFDYFAGEIFQKMDRDTQAVLLHTALFPKVTGPMAQQLTGVQKAGRILAELHRKNYFTLKHGAGDAAYQYHPLFRAFLLGRLQETYAPQQLRALRTRAAAVLTAGGQVEPAAELLREAEDWSALGRLAAEQAAALVAQGRTQTLEAWLRHLPAEVREAAPWLEYWLGVCRLPFSPPESQGHFERAFALFKRQDDAPGLLAAWSGVMESIIYGWNEFSQVDRWIQELDALLRAHPDAWTPQVEARVTMGMFVALVLRQPHHPEIRHWHDRALHIAQTTEDLRVRSFMTVYLVLYYLWTGEHAGAVRVIKGLQEVVVSPNVPPLPRVTGKIVQAMFYIRNAEHDLCRKTVAQGLEIARASGVLIWNSQLLSQQAINALSQGDYAEANEYLHKMESALILTRRVDACMYHYNSAWAAILERDMPRAAHHAKGALNFALEAGTPLHQALCHAALADVCHEQGEWEQAQSHLAEAQRIAVAIKTYIIQFMCLLLASRLAFARDATDQGIASLRRAMALGRERAYLNCYGWRPQLMSELCAKALVYEIETDYVRALIQRRRLLPPEAEPVPPSWPWVIKIYTLGRFTVELHGRPLALGRKAGRKPWELLLLLIAGGGRQVQEATLTDLLWPDSAGDAAHRAFLTTLQRLRALLVKEAIAFQDGRVGLDGRYIWVDALAFDRSLEQAETAARQGRAEAANRLRRAALELYEGHFTGTDAAPAISLRERLRSRYLHHAEALGRYLEQAGDWSAAIAVYLKALDVDALAEVFYQRLMRAYQYLGRRADAIAVYERCRKTLAAQLGISPAPPTETLYRTLTAPKS